MAAPAPPGLWVGQRLHLVCGAALLAAVWAAWGALGRPHPSAFWTAVAFPIAHQVFVWLTWRLELRSQAVSKTLGFAGYLVCFFALFGGRFVSLYTLASLDRGTAAIPEPFAAPLTLLITAPGLYAMYSVHRYFGVVRAAGADHFDARYRALPLVKEGIFQFTSNGMYLCGFLFFWAIAVFETSAAALIVAAFSHAYIWVHYYSTERPDMDFLYGTGRSPQSDARNAS